MDSDRDSVLESEDGKEVAVRQFLVCSFFSKSAFCTSVNHFFSFIISQQSDEDLDQEEEISHNNIKKVNCLQKHTKGQFERNNFKILAAFLLL